MTETQSQLAQPDITPPALPEKIGVILVNLGTPSGTDVTDIRTYLREFLSDRRVVEANPILWKMLLNLVILPFRASKTAASYKSIWRQENNESPLRYYTRQQAEKLAERLKSHGNVAVAWAMRYGDPSIESVMEGLRQKGCQRLVVVPLYPQYSATTTATVNDEVFRILSQLRDQPTVRIAPPYEIRPRYIEALRHSIVDHLAALDWVPEHILVSFHGVPVEYIEKGDPYEAACQRTFEALEARMPEGTPPLILTFQSRFGPREWLQPYTDKTLESMAKEGARRVAIIAPGFVSDCIETLEELQVVGRDLFQKNGGEKVTQIPCLNDSKGGMDVIEDVVRESLAGWI